jgi:hypothetical protein
LTLSILSLFAILPSPLIIGAVIDETCVVWGTKCGQQTNCLVYDIDKMRIYLAIFPAICICIALLFDVGVWYHAKDLKIYDSETTTPENDAENASDDETSYSTEIDSKKPNMKMEKINLD